MHARTHTHRYSTTIPVPMYLDLILSRLDRKYYRQVGLLYVLVCSCARVSV